MEKLKVHITYVTWEIKYNENTLETATKICSVYDKRWLQIAKSETGLQSYVLVTRHWQLNPDQDAHQTSIKNL